MPTFVFIGLPASESTNALILPITGHELGHSVWRVEKVANQFEDDIKQNIKTQIVDNHWPFFRKIFPQIKKDDLDELKGKRAYMPAYTWSIKHCEEIFCDLMGLYIFGQSYLQAFDYLLAPRLSKQRMEEYPSLRARADFLCRAARELNVEALKEGENERDEDEDDKPFAVEVLEKFDKKFDKEDDPFPRGSWTLCLLEISDKATEQLFPDILRTVIAFCEGKELTVPARTDWKDICRAFDKYVPASNIRGRGLPEIINAGWEMYLNPEFLSEPENSKKHRRLTMINELVLKTIEVFEIETLLEMADDS